MYTKTGTLLYMAPEMFSLSNYDESVDMWAIGVLTYKLLSGSYPFYHEYVGETQDRIMNCSYEFDTQVPERWLDKMRRRSDSKIDLYFKNKYSENDLDEKYTFIKKGPYLFSRHPIYFFSIIIKNEKFS